MKIFRRIQAIVIILLCASCAVAQNPGMAGLKTALARFKAFQTYGFESEMNAVFPDGSKDRMKMVLYMDKPGKRVYYSNDGQTMLVTEKWAFQADHKNHKASVFNVAKYNEKYKAYLPEVQQLFSEDLTSLYIDSFLLKQGRLKTSKRVANLSTYELDFPANNAIKELVIVVDEATGMPETIRMKTFQPAPEGRYNKSKGGTTVETICRNYRKTIPDSAFDPMKYFQVRAGKAYLLQYKNYKLTSIL